MHICIFASRVLHVYYIHIYRNILQCKDILELVFAQCADVESTTDAEVKQLTANRERLVHKLHSLLSSLNIGVDVIEDIASEVMSKSVAIGTSSKDLNRSMGRYIVYRYIICVCIYIISIYIIYI